jgi:cytochrome c biogenesis protein CcmG, thiol:disulfide interchange protein DsbE
MSDQPTTENDASSNPVARSKRTGLIVTFAVLLALLGLLAWGLKKVQAGPVSSGRAPDFSLTSFDGRTLKLSELGGQVVIINFWASWCRPCREEAAYLEQTWRKYEGKGVVFIGVDWVDTEKEALAYMDEFDLTYLNGPDIGTRIAQAYNIQGVPETFYVAKNGELRGVHIGPLKSPELDDKIDELLAEKYP